MKKLFSLILASVISLGCLAVSAGCQTQDNVVTDDKTINVRLYKAGFGELFFYELKQKFEEVYAEQGYKMNILTPTSDSQGTAMIREMSRGYESTKIDLYVTGAIMPNHVSKTGEYGEVCENLEELVFNQTAINYDGTESEQKISEKIPSDFIPFLRSDDGTMYGFNWAQTTAGLVVNTSKLNSYGITELPRTTNELFDVFDTIRNGVPGVKEGSDKTKTFPVTYNLSVGAGGAAGYQNCALETWLAQYDINAFNEFFRMQTKVNGSWVDMEDGYKIFENENIRTVLEAGYRFMDKKYAAYGSSEQTLDQAQGLIMRDDNKNGAVFMLNGDWFLNEVKANYSSKLDNIEFMNVPVISALGVKLFGEGTAYNLTEERCDEVLSLICKLVDENKTIEEISALVKSEKDVEISAEDIEKVATARGVCYSRGIEHLAFITKGSTKKDIAALVLRMMASEDYAETFMEMANGSTPYAQNIKIVSKYKFVNQAKDLVNNIYFRGVNGRVTGLRPIVLRSDYMFPGESNLALTLNSRAENKSYAKAAEELYEASLSKAKTAWEEYISKNK